MPIVGVLICRMEPKLLGLQPDLVPFQMCPHQPALQRQMQGGVHGGGLPPGPSHHPAPPIPGAPHPATKPVALPLLAWQAAWPGPFSKEAHFLPLWAGLDELSSLP